jgi:hypothetical protein
MTSFGLVTTEQAADSPDQWRDVIATTVNRLDPADDDWTRVGSALTMLLVDATLAGDTSALQAASDPLRDRLATLRGDADEIEEARGWLNASLETIRWALARLPAPEEIAVGDGQDRRFLEYLADNGRSNSADLRKGIPTDHAQLSRVGRKLLASGFVSQQRVGREAQWDLTPRGRQLIRHLGSSGDGSNDGGSTGNRSRVRMGSSASRNGGGRPAARAGRAGGGQLAGARMYKDSKTGRAAQPALSETRFVVKGDRGWQIKKTIDGRTVDTRRTKKEAVERAKQIVQNAGGGSVRVQPHDDKGNASQLISVAGVRA